MIITTNVRVESKNTCVIVENARVKVSLIAMSSNVITIVITEKNNY